MTHRFRAESRKGVLRIKTERGHFHLVKWEGKPSDFGLEGLGLPEKIKFYEIQEFMPYGTMDDKEITDRNGLGSASIDKAEEIGRNECAHALVVTTDNPRFISILNKKGFQKVKDRVYLKLLES